MCVCACVQVECVSLCMCMRLYGPIRVRSMSDEGHREQMAGWSCMNTSPHISLPLCIIQTFFSCAARLSVPGCSLASMPHTSESSITRTHTQSIFGEVRHPKTFFLLLQKFNMYAFSRLVKIFPYCLSAGVQSELY